MALDDVTALIPLPEEDELEDIDEPLEMEDEEIEEEIIAFPIPVGFAPPDSAADGSVFDAHITARIEDGMIIIDSINNSKLGVAQESMPFEMGLEQVMAQSGIGSNR